MANFTGKMLGDRYRVDRFLGHGGMADVYRAQDTQRAVPLALKVLHDDLAADEGFMRWFEHEARTLEMLQHPNIVRCYGLEKSGGLSYLVMDYIDGLTLRDEILKWKGGMSAERALEIMRPVCAALFYAHRKGTVHCDIKPANIMIHRNGTVFLADFGIARARGAHPPAGPTARKQGTPAYVAPEQVAQEPAETMDIYALGVVLFEMLTGGRRPFNGNTPGAPGSSASERVLWEKANLPAPRLRQAQTQAPEAFEAVVARCLERSPERRYQNTLDLLHAMEAALYGGADETLTNPAIEQPSPGTDTITTMSAPHPTRSRALRWGISALGAAVLVAAGLLAARPFLGNGPPGMFFTGPGRTTEETVGTAPALAEAALAGAAASPTLAERATLTPASQPAMEAPSATPSPQPTPLGGSQWIAFASDRGGSLQIWIMDAALPETRRQITDLPGGACQPAWSPDARQIAFTTPCQGPKQFHVGSRIMLVDLASREVTDLKLPRSTFDPAWTADGKGLVFTALVVDKTELRHLDLGSMQVETISQRGMKNAQPAVSRDGEHVAFITSDTSRFDALWMVGQDGDSSEMINETTSFAEPSFTPDGMQVLASVNRGGENPYLALMTLNDPNRPVTRLLEESYAQRHASFSPDGQWIAFWSEITPAGKGEILIAPANGEGETRQLTTNKQADFHPAWAPAPPPGY